VKTFFKDLSLNWGAGLTVALISFPLSISLALAAGADPVTGLIAGSWAGLLGAFLVGTPLTIVGVAASIITLQAGFVSTYSDQAGVALALLTIFSGLFLILIRLFRLEEFIKFVPSSIVIGFAAGIGIIICLTQAESILGFSLLPFPTELTFTPYATLLFAVSIGLMLLSEKILPKVPSAVAVSIPALIFGYFISSQETPIKLLSDRFPDLQANLFEIPNFSQLTLSQSFITDLLIASLMIAVIIVLETLITSRFISKEIGKPNQPRKDLLGIGIINIFLGLIGGMPVLGLISRTSANIQTGAKNYVAVALYGLCMMIFTMLLIGIVGFYPFPVIAAILVRVALPLVKIPEFKHLWHIDKVSFLVAIIVTILVVFTNASIAVVVGATLSLLALIRKLAMSEFKVKVFQNSEQIFRHVGHKLPLHIPTGDTAIYFMEGMITYFNVDLHCKRITDLADMSQASTIELNMDYVFAIDYESSEILEETIQSLEDAGKTVTVTRPHPNVKNVFDENPAIHKLMEKTS
jgi:SulP family sulfate permease